MRAWRGSLCGIVTPVIGDAGAYQVGDTEPCVCCESPVERACVAAVIDVPWPRCEWCAVPAACWGRYEDAETDSYACDECCQHGCEDGHCEQLAEES